MIEVLVAFTFVVLLVVLGFGWCFWLLSKQIERKEIIEKAETPAEVLAYREAFKNDPIVNDTELPASHLVELEGGEQIVKLIEDGQKQQEAN